MQIIKVLKPLHAPRPRRAAQERGSSRGPLGRFGVRQASVLLGPALLIACMLFSTAGEAFGQAPTFRRDSTSFRIVLKSVSKAGALCTDTNPGEGGHNHLFKLETATVQIAENSTSITGVVKNKEGTQNTGNPVIQFSSCDNPSGSEVTWAFAANRSGSYSGFSITQYGDGGGSLSYSGTTGLDYEAYSNPDRAITLRILARQSGGSAAASEVTATLYVKVTNMNEPPVFAGAAATAPHFTVYQDEGADGSTTPVSVATFSVSDPDDSQALIVVTDNHTDYDIQNGNELRYIGSGVNLEDVTDPANVGPTTYQTVVVSAQSGSDNDTGKSSATFRVRNVDMPKFEHADKDGKYNYTFNLVAGMKAGDALGTVTATPLTPTTVTYSIHTNRSCNIEGSPNPNPCNYKDSLEVNPTTGEITFDHIKRNEPVVPVPGRTYAANRIPDITLYVKAEESGSGCSNDEGSSLRPCETSWAKVTVKHTDTGTGDGDDDDDDDDNNDGNGDTSTPLTFSPATYTVTMPADSAGTFSFTSVNATGGTAPLTYSITQGNTSGKFAVSATGAISYTGTGETANQRYTLRVTARDSRTPNPRVAHATVNITARRTTLDPPKWGAASYTFDLPEAQAGNLNAVAVGTVVATASGGIKPDYALTGHPSGKFTISRTTGAITYIGRGEDFEKGTKQYNFNATASDGTNPAVPVPVTVSVKNVNEAPEFAQSTVSVNIREDIKRDAVIATIAATDPDAGAKVTYTLSGTGSARFAVSTAGVLTYVGTGEDFEKGTKKYELSLKAEDNGSPKLSSTATVTLNVTNVPEGPRFAQSSYAVTMAENVPGPLTLGNVVATHDEGRDFGYRLDGDAASNFDLSTTGVLTYEGSGEDFETDPNTYTFKAIARDTRQLEGEATITVTIVNAEEAPIFTQMQYDLEIDENVSGPVTLGSARANDPESDTFSYDLEGADSRNFSINPTSGNIQYTGSGEDYESGTTSYEFNVTATDVTNRTGTARVVVAVNDVNEAPSFDASSYAMDLDENKAGPLVVGTVAASDPDGDDLRYSLSGLGSGAPMFSVNNDGDISYNGAGEDYEDDPGPHVFDVVVTDPGDLTAEAVVTVVINDLNEAPTFDQAAYAYMLPENQPGPVSLGAVRATDPDRDQLTYSLSGAGAISFSVNASSGDLRYIGQGEDFESGPASYEFSVTASDRDGLSATASATVTITDVNEAPMMVGTIPAMTLQVGQSSASMDVGTYFNDPDGDPLTFTAAVADAAVAAAVLSGSGLVINATSIGVTDVTVSAADPDGLGAEQTFTVTVDPNQAERAMTVKLSLAAMARTIGTETVDVLGSRLNSSRSRNHARVMGNSISCGIFGNGNGCTLGALAHSASGFLNMYAGSRHGASAYGQRERPMEASLYRNTSFQAARGAFVVWGRANVGSFESGTTDGISTSGSTSSFYVGADYQMTNSLMIGAAVSRTAGDIDFAGALNGEGNMEVALTGVYPYLQFASQGGLSIWGTAGGGVGTADITEDIGDAGSIDLDLFLVAAGARQRIGNAFAIKADYFAVEVASDGSSDADFALGEVSGSSNRLRLAPEIGMRRSNGAASYSASVELGFRVDGGDIDTGMGAEAGVSGSYAHSQSGFSVDVRARTLLVHEVEDYTDWGGSLTLRLAPGGDQGLAIALEPSWGNAHGGANALFGNSTPLRYIAPSGDMKSVSVMPSQMGLHVNYKMAVSERTRMAPFSRVTSSGAYGYQVQAGARLDMTSKRGGDRPLVAFDVFGEQHISGNVPGGTRFGLRGTMRLN